MKTELYKIDGHFDGLTGYDLCRQKLFKKLLFFVFFYNIYDFVNSLSAHAFKVLSDCGQGRIGIFGDNGVAETCNGKILRNPQAALYGLAQ